jgi:hypothetical protein
MADDTKLLLDRVPSTLDNMFDSVSMIVSDVLEYWL